jgi:heterodisulfide reductase subunit A2
MRIGVYFCRCGGIISDRIDSDELQRQITALGDVAYFTPVDMACSDDDLTRMVEDIREQKPERVVVAACSPREHEQTFRNMMSQAGKNPFLMQLVNLREHIAWVTPDKAAATAKAVRALRGAIERVKHHEPLEKQHLDVSTDTVIIGAGPAGLKAALSLVEAGRKVILVEKEPILGGMPVLHEEVFPKLECGPCLLEPLMAEVLREVQKGEIELFLLSQVEEVVGSFGNFGVKIRQQPRYVDLASCIGCAECMPVCPAGGVQPVNLGMSQRKAIDFAFFGGLPNAPYLDAAQCVRLAKNEECNLCREACLVEGAIRFDDTGQVVTRQVGAILVAVGGEVYDATKLPQLGHRKVPGVMTSSEFERILASSGPTGGEARRPEGEVPKKVAIIHCVGSLDTGHQEYCSGICCLNAFKFTAILGHKAPEAEVTHYYRTLVAPGKDEHELMRRTLESPRARFITYGDIGQLSVAEESGRAAVRIDGRSEAYDMVVLMPAIVPSAGAAKLGEVLDLPRDRHGFFEEMHGRVDTTRSKVRGIYLAGMCQAPMNMGQAMTQGNAAAGSILAALVPGRQLEVDATYAVVDEDHCSACKSCLAVCPYKAVSYDEEKKVARVNAVLCMGCGTCVAGCPSGAISARHFTNQQIMAEVKAGARNGSKPAADKPFEPRIVGFLCNWCSYAGADKAGAAQLAYPPNVHVVRIMCTGRMDPQFALQAFDEGADGVLILGCHPGDCHYKEQNFRMIQRQNLFARLLREFGIEEERCRLDFVSAAEGEKFARVITEMTETVRRLGPLQRRMLERADKTEVLR